MGRGVECTSQKCSNETCADDEVLKLLPGECCYKCLPKSDCVRQEENSTVEIDGCVSDQPVLQTSCKGTCGSNATATFMAPFMKTDCKCCKPTQMSKKSVTLTCDGGTTKEHEYVQIDACACEACQYNPFAPTSTLAPEISTQLT